MLEKVEGIVLAFLVFVASHCYGRCGDATSGKRRGAALGRRVQLQAANARRKATTKPCDERCSGSGLR